MNQNLLKFKISALAVVLFAYNEEGNLLRLLRRLKLELNRIIPEARVQYCICIQGVDKSGDELRMFSEELGGSSFISWCKYPAPIGVSNAANASFALVHGTPDAYLMMDCDLNHQPEDLYKLLQALEPNSVVIGSRFCADGKIIGMPLWKHLLSLCFNQLASRTLQLRVRDKTSGFRMIACERASEILPQVTGSGFDFYIEHLLQLQSLGLTLIEVPITFLVRTHGTSKMKIGQTIMDYAGLLMRLAKRAIVARRHGYS